MRAKMILPLCCVLTLLMAGATLAAEPGPALAIPAFDEVAPAPVCSEPQNAQAEPGGGPVTEAACPANVWQDCYRRYGTCALCFCLGSACECENRCV